MYFAYITPSIVITEKRIIVNVSLNCKDTNFSKHLKYSFNFSIVLIVYYCISRTKNLTND